MKRNRVATFDEHAVLELTDLELRLLAFGCADTPLAGGGNQVCASDVACLEVAPAPATVNGVCTESGYGVHFGGTNLICGTNAGQIDGGNGTLINGACGG